MARTHASTERQGGQRPSLAFLTCKELKYKWLQYQFSSSDALVLTGPSSRARHEHGNARYPSWGKPTVQHFREGAGNVGSGRTRPPFRHRKSGDRKLPTYGCARLCSTRPPTVPTPLSYGVKSDVRNGLVKRWPASYLSSVETSQAQVASVARPVVNACFTLAMYVASVHGPLFAV